MAITNKYIRQIGHDLTGLKIEYTTDITTGFNFWISKKPDQSYITINKSQIEDIAEWELIRRGVILKYKYIYVILHEVAHYKKCKSFKTTILYDEWANKFLELNEDLADRYARRYAPRFIKRRRT